MSKVILDATLRAKLNGLNEQLEVCDEQGQTVGHFIPEASYKELVMAWLKTQVSDEELIELRQQEGGRSLAEIWKSLGQA